MKNITEFMTPTEAAAYGLAASLAAANERDRAAWFAGVDAIAAAKERAIAAYTGPVKTNRHGQPFGGVHPAIAELHILDLRGCYSPAE